jgi:serine/threonine-protein kinase
MLRLTGERIGNYEIIGMLGEGGMAVVYRARQVNVQRDVAFKVIESRLANSPDFIKRFEREAHTIANLNHPHILKLFDFGQHESLIYLVMELQPGGSLAQWLRNEGALPADQVARYVAQIGSALDYAHARGIVHRDLKPQNVLLDEQMNAILTDFGIARIVGDVTALTGSGMTMGTPAYMAPEQWHSGDVDARTDLYALAAIAYELLTARTPFVADTPPAMMYQHLHEAPPPLRELRPDLPASLEQVLLMGMAKQPEDRFQTAQAFSEAFQQALNGKLPQGVKASTAAPVKTAHSSPPRTGTPTLARQKAAAVQNRSQLPLLLGGVIVVAVIGIVALLIGRSGDGTTALSPVEDSLQGAVAVEVSATASHTPTPTFTATATVTPSATPTNTATPSPSPTQTATHTATLTVTMTATLTHTASATQTNAPTLPPDQAAQATIFAEQTRLSTVSLPTAYQATLEANLTQIVQTLTATVWTATPIPSPTFTPSRTPSATPTLTPTPTPQISATPSPSASEVFLVITAPSINIRSGPSLSFGVVGAFSRDERIQLIGTNNDYSWVAFNYQNGVAWITTNDRLVTIIGDLRMLPILGQPRPPATGVPPTKAPATQPASGGGSGQPTAVLPTQVPATGVPPTAIPPTPVPPTPVPPTPVPPTPVPPTQPPPTLEPMPTDPWIFPTLGPGEQIP